MRLHTRLIGAFLGVAMIALVGAILGFWQVNRLGSALYEIGVVRLPSLQGLAQMRDAATTIEQSARTLAVLRADSTQLASERAIQERAWAAFRSGRELYEPLPQTPLEHETWLAFDRALGPWRATNDSLLAAPGATPPRSSGTVTDAEVARLRQALDLRARKVDSLLSTLVSINLAIADEAKGRSIASARDMQRVRAIALASALLSVLSALAFAVLMGRRFSRPMVQMARALDNVSRGDRTTRLAEEGDDEMRRMARAMNSMVETLRESEARFRSAMQNSPIGMAIVAPDTRWREVNPAFCTLVGRTREELLATSVRTITHSDDIPEDLEYLRRAMAGEIDVWEREKRYIRPDGSDVWVQLNISIVRGDDGAPLHFVAQMQDITERRSAVSELRALTERHQRYEKAMTVLTRGDVGDVNDVAALQSVLAQLVEVVAGAVDVARVTIWEYREERTLLHCIEGFDRRSRTHLKGRELTVSAFRELFESDFMHTDVLAWDDPASDPRAREFTAAVLAPEGLGAYLRAHIRSQGRLIGSLVLSHAAGPRHWTPDEQSFVVSVANLVSARLAHMDRLRAESQVRHAEKMNAVGQLAGGVAHDFNNLLTVINGCSDLLSVSMGDTDPSNLELVSAIRDAGTRAAGLTRQLLLFSRKAVIDPQVMQVNDALKGTLRMLQRLIGEDIVLEAPLGVGLRPVVVDPGQLEQVVMNLVVNARDAMPRGGRLVVATRNADFDVAWCKSHPDYLAGSFVQLTVSDTGAGMTPDVLRHVFEPFFTTKEAGKGTGLGLATVYGIVQQSGGFVAVESAPGVGSSFHVCLPALIAPPVAMNEDHARESGSITGTETILLVEDDREVRRIARKILTLHGYTVLEAAGGLDAIRVLEFHTGAVHLLVSDVVMPEMNGREVYDMLRASHPELKVVYMSGYNDQLVLDHGMSSEGDPVLTKPFTAAKLAQTVREALDRTR